MYEMTGTVVKKEGTKRHETEYTVVFKHKFLRMLSFSGIKMKEIKIIIKGKPWDFYIGDRMKLFLVKE